jgi:hypothetical protein
MEKRFSTPIQTGPGAHPAIPYFSTLSHKQHEFWKMIFNIKCVICILLRFYTAQNGNSIPTLGDNVAISTSRIMQSKCAF